MGATAGRQGCAATREPGPLVRTLVGIEDVLQIEIETDNLINESFEVDDFTQRFQKVCG
jgi:hypothetical protein